MNPERAAHGVPEFVSADFILPGKDLDAFRQSCAFDRQSQPQGRVIKVNAALASQGRLLEEDPEMPAAVGLLKRWFDPVLPELILEFQQVSGHSCNLHRWPHFERCVRGLMA
jgi:hypothetical protein